MKIKKHLSNLAKKSYYFSNKRYCPVCKKKSRRFATYGLRHRPEAQCTHCQSLERHRLLWLYFEKKTDLFTGRIGKMLHIAPEKCFQKQLEQVIGDGYITADLNNPLVKVKMDITEIPFEDQFFNTIYCSHVLEHVPDDRKAIRELYRVLENDGWAVLLVPITVDKTIEDPSVTDPKERERLFGQRDHVRRYGPDFIDRVRDAGFHVTKILPRDFLTEKEIVRCKTTDHTPIYYCTKR